MDKKGEGGITALGFVFLAVLGTVIICGFVSPNFCDRILIAVGIFGLICLFLRNLIPSGFMLFLFLTFISLMVWVVLRATGVCTSFGGLLSQFVPKLNSPALK